MANIAFGKLCLEKEWINSHFATDGDSEKYSISNGYAQAEYPANFTIDLKSIISITTIRFLLWDNLGKDCTGVRAFRNYRYEIQLSLDGERFETYYDTGLNGSDGWQVFEAAKEIKARFVRIVAKFNNVNSFFHIVEFEVHDQKPLNYFPDDRIGIRETITHPIQIFSDTSLLIKLLKEETDKAELLNRSLTASDDTVKKTIADLKRAKEGLDLINRTIDFSKEAEEYKENSNKWLIASIVLAMLMVGVILWFYKCDTKFAEVAVGVTDTLQAHFINVDSTSKTSDLIWLDTDKKRDVVKSIIYLEFSRFILVRLFLFSILSILFGFTLRNFKVQRHNYSVNKQKALSLAVAMELRTNLTKEGGENLSEANKILISAAEKAFQSYDSGYLKDEVQQSSLINRLIDAVNKLKP